FIRSRNLNVSAGVSFDITKSKTDFAPGLAAIETRDNQRIIRANSEISYLDDWNGFNAFSGSVSQGLELFGSSEKGDAKLSRPLGDPRFTKVSGEISRLQHLYGPLSVLIGVAGQYSFEPLLSSEEFGFGGSGFGRGYDTSQITGDQGIGSKIEFDFDQVLPLRYLNAYQVYTFYDFGKVWHRDPSVGQEAGSSAASAGLGTRFSLIRNIKGDAFMAKPLTQDIPSRGVEANNWRFQFSLTSNF
ncbi:MAG: Hemolysin activation/secretion protein, partial [Alphaproteobacteria bacterium]|nr:Hemolysin activation/secretion protein [Alphaproteobacteria bacterium]